MSNGLIIPGSKTVFTISLKDGNGAAISLTPYTSGNLVFCNQLGVRTVIALVLPGANPDKGEIPVTLSSVQTAGADIKWKDADLELIDALAEKTLVLLNDMFEIDARNCPPIIP